MLFFKNLIRIFFTFPLINIHHPYIGAIFIIPNLSKITIPRDLQNDICFSSIILPIDQKTSPYFYYNLLPDPDCCSYDMGHSGWKIH